MILASDRASRRNIQAAAYRPSTPRHLSTYPYLTYNCRSHNLERLFFLPCSSTTRHNVAILRRPSKPRLRPGLRPKPPVLSLQLRRPARLRPRHTLTSILRLRRPLILSSGLWLARIRLQLRRASRSSTRGIRTHGRAGRFKDRLARSPQHRRIRRGATFARRAGRRLQSRQGQGASPPPTFCSQLQLTDLQTLAVLNPFSRIDQHLMDDSDLAGPVLFFLMVPPLVSPSLPHTPLF